MQKLLFVALFSWFGFSVMAQHKISEKEKAGVASLLRNQSESWNRGDIEGFMATYWKSDQLVFVGANGPVYGWNATLERYKKGYPNKSAMGHLDFKILRIQKIDRNTVFLIGRYELSREIGDAAGHFTLVIKKIGGEWKIVSDHSSAEN